MKSFGKLMLAVLMIPFGCGFLIAVIYVVFAGIAMSLMPSWAQPAVQQWMMDVPQNSDYIQGVDNPVGSTIAGATNVPWVNYSDPATSNITGTPVRNRDKPLVNCWFGRQSGYTMNGGFHPGVDWPVPSGTPVYSILGGEVVFADFNATPLMVENPPESNNAPAEWQGKTVSEWGGLVVVQNGDYQVWYAHMEKLLVSVGQIVQNGDEVGLSDSLGNSTGPHVHLGVKKKAGNSYSWIDPLSLQQDGFTGITPDMFEKIPCG